VGSEVTYSAAERKGMEGRRHAVDALVAVYAIFLTVPCLYALSRQKWNR
jgi:hypothetical protein